MKPLPSSLQNKYYNYIIVCLKIVIVNNNIIIYSSNYIINVNYYYFEILFVNKFHVMLSIL